MESITQSKSKKGLIITITAILIAIVAFGIFWYRSYVTTPFCFNFKHDTQFGDRKVEKPSNTGIQGLNGMFYYLPEVPALQTALKKEGFYVDDYEATGGNVYLGAFFGPSTQVAVKGFQKKYDMKETGEVDNSMIDKLVSLYGCKVDSSTTNTKVGTSTQD